MEYKVSIRCDKHIYKIEAVEPTQRTTSFSEEDRCEGEVKIYLTDALHQADSSAQGTPFRNTVPSNDNPKHFKPLLYGIDSFYLSYYGQLSEDCDSKLSELKVKAGASCHRLSPV